MSTSLPVMARPAFSKSFFMQNNSKMQRWSIFEAALINRSITHMYVMLIFAYASFSFSLRPTNILCGCRQSAANTSLTPHAKHIIYY
jgi:hypothetical protein